MGKSPVVFSKRERERERETAYGITVRINIALATPKKKRVSVPGGGDQFSLAETLLLTDLLLHYVRGKIQYGLSLPFDRSSIYV